ncbi:MAG TPA: hypothetical protein VFS91_04215 [Nitrobacter sp.]|nr:hypothetical protein [Nitrobacter sp.]
MPDIPIPLVGPSNEGVHPKADCQRTINLFPVRAEAEGEKARWHLQGAPGLSTLVTLSFTKTRGFYVFEGRLFVVANAWLIEVYSNGTTYSWGSIGSVRGKVTMAELNGVIVIGDGAGFYSFTVATGVIAVITQAPIGRHCIAFNQRILYVQRGTGRVYYSALNNATSINSLDFFTAENRPDDLLTGLATEDQVWLFGEGTIEVWYDSGDADNPFQRIPGGVIHAGILSEDTALRADNSLWWVEKDDQGQGIVRRSHGFTPVRVSTAAVERFTASATDLSAFSYQEQGRIFVILNADEGTWAYDVKEQLWHERAWTNPADGDFERARPELHAFAYGFHLVSDHTSGKIYKQSLDYYDHAGDPMVSRRITAHTDAEGRALTVHEFYVDCAVGVGLITGQGSDPQMMLRYSVDGGLTWSNELHRDMGEIGKYLTRARWHSLGLGRDWAFEVSISDPIPRILAGARARMSVGR